MSCVYEWVHGDKKKQYLSSSENVYWNQIVYDKEIKMWFKKEVSRHYIYKFDCRITFAMPITITCISHVPDEASFRPMSIKKCFMFYNSFTLFFLKNCFQPSPNIN